MTRAPHATRRPLVLGGGIVVLAALCALLYRDKAPAPPAPAPASHAAQPTTLAQPATLAHQNSPARGVTPGGGEEDAGEEPDESDAPVSRRAEYTAAFDRKMARKQARLAQDCAGNEILVHALDDFGEVRDRIVASAVATGDGQKTKAEQRAYEHAQLGEEGARICRAIAGQPLSKQCKRHFRYCDPPTL